MSINININIPNKKNKGSFKKINMKNSLNRSITVDISKDRFLEDYGDMYEFYVIYSLSRDRFLNERYPNTTDDAEPELVWEELNDTYHRVHKEAVVDTLRKLNQKHNEVYGTIVAVPLSVIDEPIWTMMIPANEIMIQ